LSRACHSIASVPYQSRPSGAPLTLAMNLSEHTRTSGGGLSSLSMMASARNSSSGQALDAPPEPGRRSSFSSPSPEQARTWRSTRPCSWCWSRPAAATSFGVDEVDLRRVAVEMEILDSCIGVSLAGRSDGFRRSPHGSWPTAQGLRARIRVAGAVPRMSLSAARQFWSAIKSRSLSSSIRGSGTASRRCRVPCDHIERHHSSSS